MNVTATIRDGSAALPTLNLTPANGYHLFREGLGLPGQATFRRDRATSRFVPGAKLISAVRDVETGTLLVRVEGTTMAQLDARITTLQNAARQFHFFLDVTVDGVLTSYDCEAADTWLGRSGQVEEERLMQTPPQQLITLSIPHQPT